MAREQRKDVDYFPHECVHGRKMHIIETKYGNDGYATWFKLLEQLGKANNHYIDISDETNLMFLTSVFKIDEEKTLSILTDLSKLDAIDKFLFEEHNIIYSQKFVNSVQDAYRNRKNRVINYEILLQEINSNKNQSYVRLSKKQSKNVQSYVRLTPNEANLTEVIPKVKYSKVKETKEEKTKEDTPNGVVDLKNQPSTSKIDFNKLINFFNNNRGALPEVRQLSDARKKRIMTLEKKYGKELLIMCIEKTRDSDFLQGQNEKNWIANFDWIFKPANFLKILEDNYANRKTTTGKSNEQIFTDAATSEIGKNFTYG